MAGSRLGKKAGLFLSLALHKAWDLQFSSLLLLSLAMLAKSMSAAPVDREPKMPIYNSDISSIFNEMADLMEIEGADTFRVRAYRNAAQTINALPRSIADIIDQDEKLCKLPGIGKSMADKIMEIVHTGQLKQFEKLRARIPSELSEFLSLSGLGPVRVKSIHDELGIEDCDHLAMAARDGKLRQIAGIGPKTEQKILEDLEARQERENRLRLLEVEEIAEAMIDYLLRAEGVKQAVIAGSYRRRQETVGDLDIVVTCKNGSRVMEWFSKYDDVDKIVSKGKTRSTVRLRSGLQIDLRVVAEVSYGAALHYFTGSKTHNIAVRKIGVENNLKINEYGVFRGNQRIAGRHEEEVYEQIGLPYIEPELRENRGEVNAAKQDALPALITRADIRGDLHCHTKASDGKSPLEAMVHAAEERNYSYLAITEHSKRLTVAQGMDEKRLRKQIHKIDKLNESHHGIQILKGIECDILEDGSLDLDDGILAELDVVVCSIHSKFGLPADQQTERVIRAMDNPHFNILAHPSGRMIGQRGPHELDIERTIEAALDRGCFLEINSQPDRLDLNDIHCKLAKDMGLKLAISTDAHSTNSLDYIRYGIDQARRGWLEPDDIINTRDWKGLKKILKRI